MKIKGIIDEDFTNYYKTSMFIATCKCNWKCCLEANIPISVCQNSELANQPNIEVSMDEIFHRYQSNSLSHAIVIGGLEPFMQFEDILNLIKYFRSHGCNDDFVIYTGFYDYEIKKEILDLQKYKNITLKTGRYKPNNSPHYDKILGVSLVSDNQKGVKIS